jgi:methionyl aminopeptidase
MRPKTQEEIANMRIAGGMLARVLEVLKNSIKPGMTTQELDDIARNELQKLGGNAPFLGYQGFPATLCVSVNEEVVHGIPGSRIIQDGDIVGMDYGVEYRGMITDSAITVGVGQVSPEAQQLMDITKKSMMAGIKAVKAGAHVGDISAAVEAVLKPAGYGIVEDLAGHGVGDSLHEEPWIPNFGKAGKGPVLEAGMTICIEPMATLGGKKVRIAKDGWTVYTKDMSLAAHFEHTILVTEKGHEILTELHK